MSYVHPFSKRCDKSEIDLFRVPPTQQSLERGRWIDYAPLSSVTNADNAITFLIAGTDEYIDLSKTIYLFIYLFNFANKHLQGEHTKTYMDNWQETRYSFCHLQRPLQKDTTNSK